MSRERRSHYDVTNSIDVSSPVTVCAEVSRLLQALYPGVDLQSLQQAFDAFGRMYAGVYPGYHGCDTWYHDAQHSLECALAMARLIDGSERAPAPRVYLGERRAVLGVICALFHDVGYLRRLDESEHRNGAEFTLCHVTRGGEFLESYLPEIGFGTEAALARELLHFTGYEMALEEIQVDSPAERWLGFLLGTADIVAQFADRCYLEKCRRFLYHEFEICGLAGPGFPEGPQPLYSSPEDLLRKTPEFVRKLFEERLDGYFEGAYRCLEVHFAGGNPYLQEIRTHVAYVERLIATGQLSVLRRRPRSINARALRKILGYRLAEEAATRRRAPARRRGRTATRMAVPERFIPT